MGKIGRLIEKYPAVTFVIGLGLIFLAIFAGRELRSQEVQEDIGEKKTRKVEVFELAAASEVVVQGEVDRADTITLVATAPGIVRSAAVQGGYVYKGQQVVMLGDSYTGASGAQVALEQAQRGYEYQKTVFELQEDIYNIQEDDINKTKSDEARIARKQIDLQERANEFTLDSAKLARDNAQAQAARYMVGAPFSGTVESQLVRIGEQVSVGSPLAVLKAESAHDAQVVAYVGKSRAASIDLVGQTFGMLDGQRVPLEIVHIAKAPDRTGAYAITLSVPRNQTDLFSDGGFVAVHLQLSPPQGGKFIPLDSVRYGSQGPEVYIERNAKAKAIRVTLGDVLGSYVTVTKGLEDVTQVILDRSISDGEDIEIAPEVEVSEASEGLQNNN
jgi:RND family efflux transporter MFP subunit